MHGANEFIRNQPGLAAIAMLVLLAILGFWYLVRTSDPPSQD